MTRRDARLLLLFAAGTALLFLSPFLAGRVPYAGDVLYSFQPWLTYAAQELQAGRLPLWNPYSGCGEAFLANPQTMLFFPAAQLFWTFPFFPAWGLFLLVSQTLLFGSFYLLARRAAGRGPSLLAATAAAWGGFVTVLWEFPGAGATLSWIPLFLVLAAGRLRTFAAMAAAVLLFSGYTPFACYALLLAAAALALRSLPPGRDAARGAALWIAAGAAGLLVAMVQVLPSWELTRRSVRVLIGEPEARAFLLNPAFLVKFLLPDIFDKAALAFSSPAFGPEFWPVQRNWLNAFTVGIPVFLLGLAGLSDLRRPRARFWAAVFLLACALAMGAGLPLLRLLPGIRYMNHFSNLMLLAVIALCVGAAGGLKDWERLRRRFWIGWGAAALLCGILLVSPAARTGLLRALLQLPELTAARHAHVLRAAGMGMAVLALTALAALAPSRLRAPLFVLLTLGKLWHFHRGLQPLTDAGFFHEPAPLAKALRGIPERYALSPATMQGTRPMAGGTLREGYQGLRQALYPNTQLPFRVHASWGYEVFPLKEFAEFRHAIRSPPLGPPMDFAGGAVIASIAPLPAPARLLARNSVLGLYRNPGALPRVTWVPRSLIISDGQARLDYLSERWDPQTEVVLEEKTEPGMEAAGAAGAAPAWRETPGRVEAQGRSPGWLVYSGVFYPGWEAYINGERVPLRRANHAFQTAKTPAGDWKAVLTYRPRLFRTGLILALFGCLVFAAASIRRLGRAAARGFLPPDSL